MIEQGEFIMQDAGTKRDIQIKKDLDLCFLPGQRVQMSMNFCWPGYPPSTCPSCYVVWSGSEGGDVECQVCGTVFEIRPEIPYGYRVTLGGINLPFKILAWPSKTLMLLMENGHKESRMSQHTDAFDNARRWLFERVAEKTRKFRRIRITYQHHLSPVVRGEPTAEPWTIENQGWRLVAIGHSELHTVEVGCL